MLELAILCTYLSDMPPQSQAKRSRNSTSSVEAEPAKRTRAQKETEKEAKDREVRNTLVKIGRAYLLGADELPPVELLVSGKAPAQFKCSTLTG